MVWFQESQSGYCDSWKGSRLYLKTRVKFLNVGKELGVVIHLALTTLAMFVAFATVVESFARRFGQIGEINPLTARITCIVVAHATSIETRVLRRNLGS